MEKINIAELLRDCPQGLELDCTCADNVAFDKIIEYEQIKCVIGECHESLILDKYGRLLHICCPKCVIFPKGKTTWKGFVPPIKFNDGDIVYIKATFDWVCIYKENKDTENFYKYVAISPSSKFTNIVYDKVSLCRTKDILKIRIATEKEKQKLFDAIKENGYKWDSENKILEKLTESKENVNDKVVMSGIYFNREDYADEVELHLNNYEIEIRDGRTYAIFKNQKTKTLEKLIEPYFKVGDRIRHKSDNWLANRTIKSYDKNIGYFTTINDWVRIEDQDNWELVPKKFDIITLKPFDRVLGRNKNTEKWHIQFFEKYDKTYQHPFICMGYNKYKQCIPYEGNEHLFGSTNDCDDFYKIWEK